MKIIWLDQVEAQAVALVGGKGANLSRLYETQPIPPGFCLTAMAQPTIDAALYQELAAAYQQLAERCGIAEPRVAVRSSAVDEDGSTTSFAGIHETVLNVQGLAAVVKAVEQCWASARSPRALAYREEQGLPTEPIRLAVIVQQFIPADLSLVAFSANPVSGEQGEIVINAVWGLGEGLVSGQLTPDVYLVRKADLKILSRQNVSKSHMVQAQANGGTEVVDVSPAMRVQAVLDDNQILDVARRVVDLEQAMNLPVDVEAVYYSGQFFLLQCRPITTLNIEPKPESPSNTLDISWDRPEDAAATWFRSGDEPELPLQQSMSLYYYQGWAKAFRELRVDGGLRVRFFNGYSYRLWSYEPTISWGELEKLHLEAEEALPRRWAEAWLPAIQADLSVWRTVDLEALAHDQLAVHLHTMLTRQLYHWEIHAQMGSLPLRAVQRLIDWYLDRFLAAPESEPYQLVQGQVNTSLENNHRLWELSSMVTPEVEARLEASDWEQLPEPFQRAFEAYLHAFFYASDEQKKQTAALVLHYARHQSPDPLLEIERLAAEREQFITEIRSKLAEDELPKFDRLLACALANNPLTENHNFWLDRQSNNATQSVIAEFGRRLVKLDIIDQAEEVSFLTLYELIQWGFGLSNPLRPLVLRRKLAHERNKQFEPPAYLGAPSQPSNAGDWVDRFSGPASPLVSEPGQICGIGASAGRVRGPARVVRNLNEALALQQGEILVCGSTDPDWTPLFTIAAALVTDSGGSLAHAAVLAREYRLPAVVGTHTGTQQITTGQLIEVDGLNGVVRLLTD